MSDAGVIIVETGRPQAVVCDVLGVPRSSLYAAGRRSLGEARKRGPKTPVSDEALVVFIREVLTETSFHGEGHKKVRARLRYGRWGLKVGKNRVLRLMRLNGLLAPVRRLHEHGNKSHDGRIVTDRPNDMWGADATTLWTDEDGLCWFFGVADHFNSECVGHVVEKIGDRWAAIESLRIGVRKCFGRFEKDIARGISLRHDWGSQYTARDFQADIRFAGLCSTPAYVGEPETNGVAERFMRTLKEQCICLHRFKNIEEARRIIGEFVERYNREWILERLNYKTPVAARADYYAKQVQNAA